MFFASYAALVLGQGMPFRGMVHEGTTFIQKDPLDETRTYPVATSDGRNYVVSLSSRSGNFELYSLNAEGQAKRVLDLKKTGHAYRNINVRPNSDGTFWVTAVDQESTPESVGPNRLLAALVDSGGKLKFQKTLDIEFSRVYLADTDDQGNLFAVGNSVKKDGFGAIKLDTSGSIAWKKTIPVKAGFAPQSVTCDHLGNAFVFASPTSPSGMKEEDRGVSCIRIMGASGESKERFSPIQKFQTLFSATTDWNNAVYTAAQNTDGTTSFLVFSTSSLLVAANTGIATAKLNVVFTMAAHPTRGIFVGGNDAEFKPALSLFSYGGKRGWSQPASVGGLKGRVSTIAIDRYRDVYAAGNVDTGIFLTKIARSSGGGEEYRQLVTFGWIDGLPIVPIAVNSDTGEVLASSYGRVARFAQSPLLYTKIMDMVEDETLSGRNALEGDRYTAGGEVVVVVPPRNGTLKLGKDGKFTYTPKKDFVGNDGFSYRVNKQSVSSFSGAVSIRVAAAPKNKG